MTCYWGAVKSTHLGLPPEQTLRLCVGIDLSNRWMSWWRSWWILFAAP